MGNNMAIYGLRHQRARFAGEAAKLTTINDRYQKQIDALMMRIATNQLKIQEYRSQITMLGETARTAFDVSLEEPVPRRTVAKRHMTNWGGLTRAVLRQLGSAQGAPMDKKALASRINAELGLNLPPAGISELEESIRYTLKRLGNKNKVARAAKPYSRGLQLWVIADFVA